MLLLYRLAILLYRIFVHFGCLFNDKARKFVSGRKGLFKKLQVSTKDFDRIIWIHAASLGEFEQGRPIIEKLHLENRNYRIVLSFFSPSGFEVRKNYDKADCITYLPLDSRKNAERFIDILKPKLVMFIKYEFWYFYLDELTRRKIPTLIVSGIFRERQFFFRRGGAFYRRVLEKIDHFFVQDNQSKDLISKINKRATVSGDTRFDRVLAIANSKKSIEKVETFLDGTPCFVIGSSWENDIKFLTPFITKNRGAIKFIIAPHNISESDIKSVERRFKNTVRYSSEEVDRTGEILIIDHIGLLSSLYSYAAYAYIGGAFNHGLHNTAEAAVYGIPVFVGRGAKNYKYKEVNGLKASGGLFEFDAPDSLQQKFQELSDNPLLYQEVCYANKSFIQENAGATHLIMAYIQDKL